MEDCPICLEHLDEGNLIVYTDCIHPLCEPCACRYWIVNNNQTCPLCRQLKGTFKVRPVGANLGQRRALDRPRSQQISGNTPEGHRSQPYALLPQNDQGLTDVVFIVCCQVALVVGFIVTIICMVGEY